MLGSKGTFKEEDKKKVIDFLNFIAKNGRFTMNTVESIEYVKLLTHMQQIIVPKINENILEIKKVVEKTEEPKKTKVTSRKK